MSETVAITPPPAPPPLSLIARAIGVFTSPRATYADIAARPTVLGGLAISILLLVLSSSAFVMSARGKNLMIDQAIGSMESTERLFGIRIPDEVYEQTEDRMRKRVVPWDQALGYLVFIPVGSAVTAGIFFVVFTSIMGGEARFKQVFAIVVFAGLISTVGFACRFPLMYVMNAATASTSLGIFAPFLAAQSFLGRFFNWIDLFVLWWLVSLSIGLGVLYRKRTTPIATSLVVLYVLFAVTAAAIASALSSGA